MSNDDHNRPKAVYEPGTLDKTRKNIGDIDPDEAKKLSKLLGGEVFTEKSAPIDYTKLPKNKTYSHRAVTGKSGAHLSEAYKDEKESRSNPEKSSNGKHTTKKQKETLPVISSHNNALINKLMISEPYNIKPDFGFFNFLKLFQKNGTERILPEFCELTLKQYIAHLQTFIDAIKSLIKLTPKSYRFKIQENSELKFQLLNTVSGWSTKSLKVEYLNLKGKNRILLVEDLIPYISTIYKMVICLAYITDQKMAEITKEIYKDILKYKPDDKDKLSTISKIIITEWLYIDRSIIKGLYPLLIRMIGGEFAEQQVFFTRRAADILKYLGLSKYSLILPRKRTNRQPAKTPEKRGIPQEPDSGRKNKFVENGLKLLDQMFPAAGFLHLDKFPDLYPYFQPLYKFKDGFVFLSPENPLQITVILLRILEDFFQGGRKIQFEFEAADEKKSDILSKALDEWSVYRELLFEKDFCDYLTNLSNELYTHNDFEKTQYGKKIITTLLWLTKYNFLPKYQFDQLLLERPENIQRYKPLCMRVEFLRKTFTNFALSITQAEKTKGKVDGIKNPWDRYDFGISNPVSKRLDVLLGAKKKDSETNATNANLVKYSVCILSVLDWWINDSSSPAYKIVSNKIIRRSKINNEPEYSVPLRQDQDKLFANSIKSALVKNQASDNSLNAPDSSQKNQ